MDGGAGVSIPARAGTRRSGPAVLDAFNIPRAIGSEGREGRLRAEMNKKFPMDTRERTSFFRNHPSHSVSGRADCFDGEITEPES